MTSIDQLTTASEDFSPVAATVSADLSCSDDSCLHITTMTWTRDSHELFDYEACQIHKRSYFLKRAARVFRTPDDVQVIPEGDPLPNQPADYLLSVRYRDGRFLIVPADKNIQTSSSIPILPKKIWLVVKDLPTASHFLKEGDVMKLGRFKLRVKQLVKPGPSVPELRLDDIETPHSEVSIEEALNKQCRICLLDGGTIEDPLVCPCECKGSIKYVHLDCLRRWINGRLALSLDEQQQKVSFFFKQLQCELCKTHFPSALNVNHERVPIIKMPKIEAPFIILENIVGTVNRGLHVITMETKKELKLGRGHESDVRIPDVSISRYHATIRFTDGEFILEDHGSKFGTLVSFRKIQPVESTHPLAVQVGRTILNMSLKRPPRPIESVLKINDDGSIPVSHESNTLQSSLYLNNNVSLSNQNDTVIHRNYEGTRQCNDYMSNEPAPIIWNSLQQTFDLYNSNNINNNNYNFNSLRRLTAQNKQKQDVDSSCYTSEHHLPCNNNTRYFPTSNRSTETQISNFFPNVGNTMTVLYLNSQCLSLAPEQKPCLIESFNPQHLTIPPDLNLNESSHKNDSEYPCLLKSVSNSNKDQPYFKPALNHINDSFILNPRRYNNVNINQFSTGNANTFKPNGSHLINRQINQSKPTANILINEPPTNEFITKVSSTSSRHGLLNGETSYYTVTNSRNYNSQPQLSLSENNGDTIPQSAVYRYHNI